MRARRVDRMTLHISLHKFQKYVLPKIRTFVTRRGHVMSEFLLILFMGIAQSGFFFLAEAGIRNYKVTGVQTCALPISSPMRRDRDTRDGRRMDSIDRW